MIAGILLGCLLFLGYGDVIYEVKWTETAERTYQELRQAARDRSAHRKKHKIKKKTKDEGFFKQVKEAVKKLSSNPRHPGLNTHEFHGMDNPFNEPHKPKKKVYEAYAQNHTPGAYRLFWCYGPKAAQITIIAITPHP